MLFTVNGLSLGVVKIKDKHEEAHGNGRLGGAVHGVHIG